VRALSTNSRTNPIGIGGETPVSGWQLASDRRATAQQAYEIQVGRGPGAAEVWSSGKVRSDRQVDVEYGGPDGSETLSLSELYGELRRRLAAEGSPLADAHDAQRHRPSRPHP
jgi:hypothetical protein